MILKIKYLYLKKYQTQSKNLLLAVLTSSWYSLKGQFRSFETGKISK